MQLTEFINNYATVIFTLLGIIITQLLSRWNLSKQLREQHTSAVEREWSQELRKVVSELNISCRVIYSYTLRSDGIVGEHWRKFTEEKEKAFSRIASLQILLNRKSQAHVGLWNELGALTKLLVDPHFKPEELNIQANKIVEETQDLLSLGKIE